MRTTDLPGLQHVITICISPYSGLLYGGLLIVPGLLYILSCRSSLGQVNLDYKLIICVYGYSSIPLIPVCIFCSMPWAIWQSFFVAIGYIISVIVCYKYLWVASAQSLPKPLRATLLGVAMAGQTLNWAVYRWYFLSSATN